MSFKESFRQDLLRRLDEQQVLLAHTRASIAEKELVRDNYRSKANEIDERVLGPLRAAVTRHQDTIEKLKVELDYADEIDADAERPKTRRYRVRPVSTNSA